MPRLRLSAAFALLALNSGCLLLPTDNDGPASAISAQVYVRTNATRTADSVSVEAVFFPTAGGGRIRFAVDTLRVQNGVGTGRSGIGDAFRATMPLDSATRAQGIRVRLPRPRLAPLPLQEFTVFSAARGGPSSIDVRAGRDLSLPVVPGRSGTLPDPTFEHWSITVVRDGRAVTINGTGPLPSPLVVPWVLVPQGTSETVSVGVTSAREFVLPHPGGPTQMTASVTALLEWNVRVLP